MATGEETKVFSAMQAGEPYAAYIKTILAQVYVSILNPFDDNTPIGVILRGDPKKGDIDCIVNVWTEKQDLFLRNTNRSHFEKGVLVRYTRPKTEIKQRPIEEFTDEELLSIINDKFLVLQKVLNNTESEAVVYRMLSLAQDAEKPVKTINSIEARLAEIQSVGYEEKD